MPPVITERFAQDHARLDREMRALVDVVEGGPYEDIRERWARFDAGLRAHFDTEERFFLPALEGAHPVEAARVRAEHDRFRRTLAELGIAADLSSLRLDEVRRFLDDLEAHAAWESDTLYPWAEEALAAPTRRSALAWLGARATELLERAG